MSNLGLERALGEIGVPFARAAVGDRFVLEQLQANGWKLGGEASGHIVCLDRTTTGDGIVSALQVLARMVESGRTLDELAAGMEYYPQVLVNVPVASKPHVSEMPSVAEAVRAIEQELGEDGRVLLRYSGTESLARVMIEGRDEEAVRRHAGRLAEVIKRELGV